jgi:glycerol-1-phosphatase
VGIDSLMVLSGAHGKRELIAAHKRPTHIGLNLAALLDPVPVINVDGKGASCGEAEICWVGDHWVLADQVLDRAGQLSALRALLAVVEPGSDPEQRGLPPLLDSLHLIR